MRKPFLLSLLVALLTTLSLHAYDFQSGDLYYNITSKTTVEVTYQERVSESNYQGLTTATIPATVTNNGTTYSVTSIGDDAFYKCSSLTSITIPNSVTSIGGSAFRDCSSLISITIGNSVTSIGDQAFFYCSSLTSITIPNSVTSIGDWVFGGCFSLTSVIWNAKNCKVSSTLFYDISANITSFTFGEEVETIPSGLCSCMSSLTSITIGNSVTSIGYRAFENCSSLTKTNYTGDLASWCAISFSGVGSNPTFYSHNLYINDVEVKDLVTFPETVTSIGGYAFSGCTSITSLNIPNSVTSIGREAFSSCSSLTSITLPNSVTSIGNYAFRGCTSLPVEDNLRYADTYLVEAVDKSLSTYTIKTGTKWIGDDAFSYCDSLTSITLPNSVTSIGELAFVWCSSLADIYCYAITPPVCDVSSDPDFFLGVSKHCYIHVPAGTIREYQLATGWRDFYHFYEISELPDGAPTDQVGVTVTGNYATFSWPVNPTASSYTLTITKDGEVFCTLIFNNMGQLVGMAFAPARNGEQSANQDDAQSTAYGFSFVVTNLDANSHYTYTFTVNGADNEVIETYSGAFDTSEETALSETEQKNKPSRKIIRDGQVLILRNGVAYDMMGNML